MNCVVENPLTDAVLFAEDELNEPEVGVPFVELPEAPLIPAPPVAPLSTVVTEPYAARIFDPPDAPVTLVTAP